MGQPRIRTVKPDFFQDERVGRLARDERLLMVGLMTMADDEGRLRAVKATVVGHVFPYDKDAPRRLSGWISALERAKIVVCYEVGGTPYIAFRHWARHQRINRPKPSTLPDPPDSAVVSQNRILPSRDDQGSVSDGTLKDHNPSTVDASLTRVPFPSLPLTTGSQGEDELDARAQVGELFAYWQEKCNHPQARLSADRRAKIEARLREGRTPEEVRQAIDGAATAPHVNDAGRRFDDIGLICRNGEKFESFVDRAGLSTGGHGISLAESRELEEEVERQVAAEQNGDPNPSQGKTV